MIGLGQTREQVTIEQKDHDVLDEDWILLFKLAKEQGLSIDDIRQFFKEHQSLMTELNL